MRILKVVLALLCSSGIFANLTPSIYYHHPNHLGSATWITDMNGTPVQYLHYMPYGELFAEQSVTPYRERFRFTGKERDEETNYDYFGARYYSSAITSWLSVDPLSDKYPDVSPYAYCSWNPINKIDPDGKIVVYASGVSDSFKGDFKNAVTYMNQNGISNRLYQLEASSNIYYLSEGIGINSSKFNSKTKTITWYSRVGLITDNLYEMSPVEILNHEIDHALRYDKDPTQQQIDKKTEDPNYGNKEEKRVITGSEQETARKLGKIKSGEVTRNNHNGSLYETTSPITNEDKWSYTPSEY